MHTVLKVLFFIIMCFVCSLVFILPEFWLWNALAPKYLTFLPEAWHQIPYWDFFSLSWLFLFLFKSEKLAKAYNDFSVQIGD